MFIFNKGIYSFSYIYFQKIIITKIINCSSVVSVNSSKKSDLLIQVQLMLFVAAQVKSF